VTVVPAAFLMVVTSPVPVSVTRGARKPWLVEYTSNFADGSGVLVPIADCPDVHKGMQKNSTRKKLFMIDGFLKYEK
jgi:hypothetical protein